MKCLRDAFAKAEAEAKEARERAIDVLWEAQLAAWPDSRRVEPNQALDWGRDAFPMARHSVMGGIALTVQYAVCVFYECGRQPDGTYRWKGCRYGVEGHEYQSGFSL